MRVVRFWQAYRQFHWTDQLHPLVGVGSLVLVFGIALGAGLPWWWA